MSARRKLNPVQGLPLVHSLSEATAHDPDCPALVPIPGHLVRPLVLLLLQLHDPTARGLLAHGLELLLCGLAEEDSSLLRSGIAKVEASLPSLTRSPEQVLAALVSEETVHALSLDIVPMPDVERTGWPDPVIPLEDGDRIFKSCRTPEGTLLELDAPVLRSREELLEHEPNHAAYVRLPAELVAGVWWIIQHRVDRDDQGEVARGLEACLAGWGEIELGETDTGCLIVQGLRQAAQACNRLIATARALHRRDRNRNEGGGESGDLDN